MSAFSFVPDGTGLVCWTVYPAINGWAIFKCPILQVSHLHLALNLVVFLRADNVFKLGEYFVPAYCFKAS